MLSAQATRTNVFISYSHRDKEALERLQVHLKPEMREGNVDVWDDTRIEPGQRWREEIDEALTRAKIAVLLISADFLASDFIANNELPPLLAAAERDGLVILQVILSTCGINDHIELSAYQAVNDYKNPLDKQTLADRAETWDRVRQAIRKVHKQSETNAEAIVPDTPHNLPFERNDYFTGRIEALAYIRQQLSEKKRAAISGMGGLGKTQIALEYAYRYRPSYRHIFWVRAEDDAGIIAGYCKIATLVNLWAKQEEDQQTIIRAVKVWMEQNKDWLIIFDNADTPSLLKKYLPREWKGQMLLTSREDNFQQLGIANPCKPEQMTPLDAKEFLLTRTDHKDATGDEEDAVEELARELDYLPLAMEQASAYICAKGHMSFRAYLTSYHRQPIALLEKGQPIIGEYHASVATTWRMNIDAIAKESPAAADFMNACAFMSPDSIPVELFTLGAAELGPNLSETLRDAADDPSLFYDDVLSHITRYSLIKYDRNSETCAIHRLVQAVVASGMDEETRHTWAERIVYAVNVAFDPKFEHWKICEKFISQTVHAASLIERWRLESAETGRLLIYIGWYLEKRGRYKDAEAYLINGLRIQEKILGRHSNTAKSQICLGHLYTVMGRYVEAESLLTQAVELLEDILTPDHIEIALALGYRANLYHKQNDYIEAELLYNRSLFIRENVLGHEHPDVAATLNNLAVLYNEQGRSKEAEDYYRRVVSINEKTIEPDHPDIASILSNIAILCENHGRYQEAEDYYHQAVSIEENAIGLDHPNVANTLNNIAVLYSNLHRYGEAEGYYKRALSIWKKAFGNEHPDVARCLKSYAALLRDMKQRLYLSAQMDKQANEIMTRHRQRNARE